MLSYRRKYVVWSDSGAYRGDRINRRWLNGSATTTVLSGIPNSGMYSKGLSVDFSFQQRLGN